MRASLQTGRRTRRPNARVAGVRPGSLCAPMSRLCGAGARRIADHPTNLGERLLEAAADPDLAACGFFFTLEGARERRALVACVACCWNSACSRGSQATKRVM